MAERVSQPGTSTAPSAERSLLWPHSVQMMLALLCVLLLANLLYQAFGKTAVRGPDIVELEPLQVEVNEATFDDLLLLPGIGPKLAQRIVDYRAAQGPFRNLDELRNIPGVGPVAMKRLRTLVYVADARPSAQTMPRGLSMDRGKSKKEALLSPRSIDLNEAAAEELQKLPGIGPKLAQRIVEHRASRGPFVGLADIRKVSGIGPKTLEKIKPYIVVGRDGSALASK